MYIYIQFHFFFLPLPFPSLFRDHTTGTFYFQGSMNRKQQQKRVFQFCFTVLVPRVSTVSTFHDIRPPSQDFNNPIIDHRSIIMKRKLHDQQEEFMAIHRKLVQVNKMDPTAAAAEAIRLMAIRQKSSIASRRIQSAFRGWKARKKVITILSKHISSSYFLFSLSHINTHPYIPQIQV